MGRLIGTLIVIFGLGLILLPGCSDVGEADGEREGIAASRQVAMFRANPQHTGVYDSKGIHQFGELKWKFEMLWMLRRGMRFGNSKQSSQCFHLLLLHMEWSILGVMISIYDLTWLDRAVSFIARIQIAQTLNMSLPAVMRIIDQLIADDQVRNSGELEATGGRCRPLLEFNGEAHAAIGIDVGGTKMFDVVADLAGNTQHEIYRLHGDYPRTEGLAWLTELIQQLLDAPRPEKRSKVFASAHPQLPRVRRGLSKA